MNNLPIDPPCDAVDALLAGVSLRLLERALDRQSVPRQRSGPLHLYDELLDAETGEDEIGEADLMVHVTERPVEDVREQVREDVLGDFLGSIAEALLLDQPLAALELEAGPGRVNPRHSTLIRSQAVTASTNACSSVPTATPSSTAAD